MRINVDKILGMMTCLINAYIDLVPNLGVNYPNWVMVPVWFRLWVFFSIGASTTTYYIE